VIFASIMLAADWSTATGLAGFSVNFLAASPLIFSGGTGASAASARARRRVVAARAGVGRLHC
jgi:hypothetical protein